MSDYILASQEHPLEARSFYKTRGQEMGTLRVFQYPRSNDLFVASLSIPQAASATLVGVGSVTVIQLNDHVNPWMMELG